MEGGSEKEAPTPPPPPPPRVDVFCSPDAWSFQGRAAVRVPAGCVGGAPGGDSECNNALCIVHGCEDGGCECTWQTSDVFCKVISGRGIGREAVGAYVSAGNEYDRRRRWGSHRSATLRRRIINPTSARPFQLIRVRLRQVFFFLEGDVR